MNLIVIFLFCIQCHILNAFEFNCSAVPEFKDVGYADGGIVRRNFVVTIPGVQYPYNPSIITIKNGYLLAFRHDFPFKGVQGTVALVKLDQNFQVRSSVKYLDTGCPGSEDPRLFRTKDGIFAIYTNIPNWKKRECHLAVSQIHSEKMEKIRSFDLDFKLSKMEKNWTPFVFEGKPHFIYQYSPQLIIRLSSSFDGKVEMPHGNRPTKAVRNWEKRWGIIRGGSPAIPIGNENLTFFHSSFESNGIRYYVMGAMAFNVNPPFQITRMSPKPIMFNGMYSIPVSPQVWFYPRNHLRVLFPGGLVQGHEDGREVFYVFCGENDVAIRSVVIDKEKLFQSLISAN